MGVECLDGRLKKGVFSVGISEYLGFIFSKTVKMMFSLPQASYHNIIISLWVKEVRPREDVPTVWIC